MTQKEFINHLFNIETKVHYRPICIRTGQAYFNEAFETFLNMIVIGLGMIILKILIRTMMIKNFQSSNMNCLNILLNL